jgi:hypothetical protein
MKAINSSRESRGLFCQLFDGELNKYIMQLADHYFQEHPMARQRPKIAVEQHGRQSDGKTWVLNEKIQINEDGDQIDEIDSPYVWIMDYVTQVKSTELCRSNIKVPLKKKTFCFLLKKLKKAVPGMCFSF